jgi:hypothetical protein
LAHPSGFKALKTDFKNEEDMGMELESGLKLFFFNFETLEANCHSSSSSVLCDASVLLVLKEHL